MDIDFRNNSLSDIDFGEDPDHRIRPCRKLQSSDMDSGIVKQIYKIDIENMDIALGEIGICSFNRYYNVWIFVETREVQFIGH